MFIQDIEGYLFEMDASASRAEVSTCITKRKKKKQGEITQQAGVPGLTFTYSTDTKYPRQGRDAQARTH